MTYSVGVAREAERDIQAAFEYIAFELGEPRAAAKLVRDLDKTIALLSELPLRRPLVGFEPWHSRNVRWILAGRYMVFYVIDTQKAEVSVIRVMYGGRDAETELNRLLDDVPE